MQASPLPIAAEPRSAIEGRTETIRCLGADDPTTRRMLENILAAEEEHAEDLVSLLRGAADRGAPAPTSRSRREDTEHAAHPRPRAEDRQSVPLPSHSKRNQRQ